MEDVAPFELAKLRLLNVSHSTLAYFGLQFSHVFVHQAVADPDLRAFVVAQMVGEAVPSLTAAAGSILPDTSLGCSTGYPMQTCITGSTRSRWMARKRCHNAGLRPSRRDWRRNSTARTT